MKIIITGNTEKKLQTVIFIKHITGFGLKDSKDLLDNLINNQKPIILDIIDYDKVKNLFIENELDKNGLNLKKFRKEFIEDLLRKSDPEYNIKLDPDYNKYLELFEYLFRNDKTLLKRKLNENVDELKKIKSI